jgi:Uma2 family endonuclease
MTQVAPTNLSAEELQRLQQEAGVEFAHGQLVEKPVSKESSRVAMQIAFFLQGHVVNTGEAEVYGADLGYQCFRSEPRRFRKPDVSVVRRERLAGLEPDPGLMPIPADLVVEVISPGDTAYDVAERVEEYLTNGFKLVWVVHPNTRTVVIHRADGSVAKLHENDEVTGEVVLPAFSCKVGEFFILRSATQPSPR